jgi:hypothetical protein
MHHNLKKGSGKAPFSNECYCFAQEYFPAKVETALKHRYYSLTIAADIFKSICNY